MNRLALALWITLAGLAAANAAEPAGYRKAYFGATQPGAWARYTMKTEGQPDMGQVLTRLPDDAGQQRLEPRIDYIVAGAPSSAVTRYVLKPGYALESDALGYGKALVAMTTSAPGMKPTSMPAAVLDAARKTMPDYAASARFVGTDNIGGKPSGHYTYTQRHPGNPVRVETGELWLNESVPFGLVRQKAVTTEESGKVVSRFELLLVDSGANRVEGVVNAPDKSAAGPLLLADAFKAGRVELAVYVVPGSGDGAQLRIGFRNKTDMPLHLTIPSGATTLDVGSPLEQLRLIAAAAKVLDIAPATTSPPVVLAQTGSRRAIDGTFTLSVFEGTPLFSGSATMGTVGR